MRKILAFGASNSKVSINHQLAVWAANQLDNVEVVEVKLNDLEMPLYSIDRENEEGIPELAIKFKNLINEVDGIIVSFAEHNGTFSVAFKNLYDWISRVSKPIWGDKPMMIMAASPGTRGGASVLKTAQETLPFRGVKLNGVYSFPSFSKNFSNGISDESLLSAFKVQLAVFESSLGE